MPLIQHAAPKPAKIKLPSLFVGSERLFEPKPTAANYYQAPSVTKLATTPRAASPVYTGGALPATSTGVTPSAGAAALGAGVSDTDYKQALADDPYLSDQLSAINAQTNAADSFRMNSARRAAAVFGEIPVFEGPTAEMVGPNLPWDDEARRLAREATLGGVSTVAKIDKSYLDAQSQFLSSLAARGMLGSSALGQHSNEALLGMQQSRYEATQDLADYLVGLWQDYLGQLSSGNAAKAAATQEALQRIIANISALNAKKQADQQAAADAAAAAQAAETARQASIGFTGQPVPNPTTGFGIPADPYTPRPGGFVDDPAHGIGGTGVLNDVNPRYVSIAEQGFPSNDPFPQPPVYGQGGWGTGGPEWPDFPPLTFPDISEPPWIDQGAPLYQGGQYGQSGGQEFYQSLRGPLGHKPLF